MSVRFLSFCQCRITLSIAVACTKGAVKQASAMQWATAITCRPLSFCTSCDKLVCVQTSSGSQVAFGLQKLCPEILGGDCACFKYNPAMPYSQIFVPTADTVRFGALLALALQVHRPVLLTGHHYWISCESCHVLLCVTSASCACCCMLFNFADHLPATRRMYTICLLPAIPL